MRRKRLCCSGFVSDVHDYKGLALLAVGVVLQAAEVGIADALVWIRGLDAGIPMEMDAGSCRAHCCQADSWPWHEGGCPCTPGRQSLLSRAQPGCCRICPVPPGAVSLQVTALFPAVLPAAAASTSL